MSAGALWVAGAAALSIVISAWWYAVREEPVRRRGIGAALRAAALFLLLAGPRLPALERPARSGAVAILVDRSLSMTLPAGANGLSRFDSARSIVESAGSARLFLFGEETVATRREALPDWRPTARRSLLAPALEAARRSGVDSALVVTDGELDDREESRLTAERIGLSVLEVRVAESPFRVGLRRVEAPEWAEAGEPVRVATELVSGGSRPGTDARDREASEQPQVEVRLEGTGPSASVLASARALPPDPGRVGRVQLSFVPRPTATGTPGWRPYEVSLAPGADPLGDAARLRFWMQLTASGGAVLVSEDPDWEARFLLPVLQRAVPGGARAYLRLNADRYASFAPGSADEPVPVDAREVRRRARAATLLVIQDRPGGSPAWLQRLAQSHPRVLRLARGAGPVPGLPVEILEPLAGEWYPSEPSASPLASLVAGIDIGALPPVALHRAMSGPVGWVALAARRDRQGPERPLAVAGQTAGRRWALVVGEGSWRWSARGGEARQLYRALFGALAGWLLEEAGAPPVTLVEDGILSSDAVRWRVAPGVRDLSLAVLDTTGRVIWEETAASPDSLVEGPRLPPGDAFFRATGAAGTESFHVERPFAVSVAEPELLPRRREPLLEIRPIGSVARRPFRKGTPAVWPYALAVLLLCVEWGWRRRVGLR